ncbi:MAG: hypothetical protein QOH42_516, partial [Blastocatellia bacterium]|nr:hypothetical protein [Blastocatellia bacterium]
MSASIAPSSLPETYKTKPFDVISEAESAKFAEFVSTLQTRPRIPCVPQLVAAQAAATPEACAVADGDEILTYRELDEQANQLAHHLIALGVERET